MTEGPGGLNGRVAVVIGGTGVLGRRIAAALGRAGARVVVVGRDHERGSEAAMQLREEAVRRHVRARRTRTDRAQLRALVRSVVESHGAIDVLVNGAGVNSPTPFLDIDDDELERIVAVNQLAVMRACQEFGRYFVERATDRGVGAASSTSGACRASSRCHASSRTR